MKNILSPIEFFENEMYGNSLEESRKKYEKPEHLNSKKQNLYDQIVLRIAKKSIPTFVLKGNVDLDELILNDNAYSRVRTQLNINPENPPFQGRKLFIMRIPVQPKQKWIEDKEKGTGSFQDVLDEEGKKIPTLGNLAPSTFNAKTMNMFGYASFKDEAGEQLEEVEGELVPKKDAKQPFTMIHYISMHEDLVKQYSEDLKDLLEWAVENEKENVNFLALSEKITVSKKQKKNMYIDDIFILRK